MKINNKYVELAKEEGFFRDNEDITLCEDYIVYVWINELDDKYKNIEKFRNDVLPNFKRWYEDSKAKVQTNGVGTYYEVFELAQTLGIEVTSSFRKMIIGCFDLNVLKDENSREDLGCFLKNLERMKNNLFDLYSYSLFYSLDKLLESEKKDSKADARITIFLDTCYQEPSNEMLKLKELTKTISGYDCFNYDELMLLYNNPNYFNQEMGYIKRTSYKDKYETIEGISYLNKSYKYFLDVVPEGCPINNLFAYIFEILYELNIRESILEYTLALYDSLLNIKDIKLRNSLMSPIFIKEYNYKEEKGLKAYNYGLDIRHFISKELRYQLPNVILRRLDSFDLSEVDITKHMSRYLKSQYNRKKRSNKDDFDVYKKQLTKNYNW